MGSRPERIGPYRIEGRLGSGGMGEVYHAWDERLERWVAIKVIRPESAENEVARERFRREARAAASLSHPAIVQIYDTLEWDGGDAIVLELVEGELLAKRIARGPLPLAAALHIGHDVAEGLAAAHARGIVHRDLKAENVMITTNGAAKILDFGLAKRLGTEVSLTADQRVMGTFRTMSPEQARGLPVDQRSDLFSLGVLLYEMLSGRSPFEAGSAMDTLTRICTHRQTSLHSLEGGIPEELSNLVDHLLEKDPVLRPGTSGEVAVALGRIGKANFTTFHDDRATWVEAAGPVSAPREAIPVLVSALPEESSAGPAKKRLWIALAVLLLVLAGIAGGLRMRRAAVEPLYVAVPRPEVQRGRGDQRAGLAESALRSSVLDALLSFEKVFPLAPDQVDEVSGTVPEIARTLGAGELVTTRLSCGAEICELGISRVRGADGGLLWNGTFQAPVDRPDLLAEAVRGHLLHAFKERPVRKDAPRLQVRPADYTEYLRLLRSFDLREEEDLPVDQILARLREIHVGSPRFLEAYTFESEVLEYRFRTGRDPADLRRAFDVLEQAHELSPTDSRPAFRQISLALSGGELDRAEAAIRRLESLQPGDARILAARARLLDRRGETARAVELMETAARRLPLWRHLFWAANMNYQLGKVDVARGQLQQLLERSPGHYVSQSKLAEIELMSGSPQRAMELYSELVQRSPQYSELTNLGLAWSLLKRYDKAAAYYRQALALAPESPLALLNLADATLLQGKRPEAESLYLEVLRVAEKDPAAESDIQILSVRAQAWAQLGRSPEALREMQKALRLAPENPQTAYEAAVVFSVLGDRASARFHAERALDQGYDPRWFSFPWFEPLRSIPKLRQRLP
ncbi:MAG TPA: protein kinase [Thermoanaerobaculia bacterium]|nr:protein kinase [Thermoanaerobaculia bacterium]